MKKISVICLCALLLFSLCACKKSGGNSDTKDTSSIGTDTEVDYFDSQSSDTSKIKDGSDNTDSKKNSEKGNEKNSEGSNEEGGKKDSGQSSPDNSSDTNSKQDDPSSSSSSNTGSDIELPPVVF